MFTDNQQTFSHNLEAARRKAGSVANLMSALDGTNMTFYGWKKKTPKRLDSKLIVALASFLELSNTEKLFTQKVDMPVDSAKSGGEMSLSKFLTLQEEIKRLRKKHTWQTLNFWMEKFDELLTLADDDVDGLKTLIQTLKPPTKKSKEEAENDGDGTGTSSEE